MTKVTERRLAGAAAAVCFVGIVQAAEVRATADVACQPLAAKLQYDCTVKLANARTNEPLGGATVRVGADMPSMPMAHNVRPVPATEGQEAGTYRARVTLEMHGDWALRIDVAGPLRDRVVKVMRFAPGRAEPAPAGRGAPSRH